jgi:hypothetical protein
MPGTHALGGYVVAQRVSVALLAAEVEVADAVLITIAVPNKALILDVILETTDMDTGATLAFDVGDASGPATADDNRFIAAFSGQAAGSIRASDSAGLLEGTYVYRNLAGTDDAQIEQEIECTINTVAATGVDGTLTMTVIYANTE